MLFLSLAFKKGNFINLSAKQKQVPVVVVFLFFSLGGHTWLLEKYLNFFPTHKPGNRGTRVFSKIHFLF